MARRKRTSPVLDKARTRATALSSIDAKLDLGKEMTLDAYPAAIKQAEDKLAAYNALLSKVDESLNDVQAAEKGLAALSDRMLGGVGSKYGKDSNEPEKAGGVRKERAQASGAHADAGAGEVGRGAESSAGSQLPARASAQC